MLHVRGIRSEGSGVMGFKVVGFVFLQIFSALTAKLYVGCENIGLSEVQE